MTEAVADHGEKRGVNRVLVKLENSIESGNYYEAHQMYRTLYFRYTGQQKFADCLELLWSGAMKLVSKQQETSAADLALLLIDTLDKRGSAENDASNDGDIWIKRLGTLIGLLNATTVERETLIVTFIYFPNLSISYIKFYLSEPRNKVEQWYAG